MRVIPVMDLKGGLIVHAKGGRRDCYQAVQSKLTHESTPAAVARAFRDHLGLTECYLADLDAIEGQEPAWPVYEDLLLIGCKLWIDAGVRQVADAEALAGAGAHRVVLGLETIAGPDVIRASVAAMHYDGITFSLDLREGGLLGRGNGWRSTEPWGIASEAIAAGVRSILMVDLARVGSGEGCGSEALCEKIIQHYPDVEVSCGGGIRGLTDLTELKRRGLSAALLASALHDGTLNRQSLADL